MENGKDIEQVRERIGRRLAFLRKDLSSSSGSEDWSQGRVGKATGLTQNGVMRLENSGHGSLEGLVKMLLFYYKHGYNLNWILAPDNTTLSRLILRENIEGLDTSASLEALETLRQDLNQRIDEIQSKLRP